MKSADLLSRADHSASWLRSELEQNSNFQRAYDLQLLHVNFRKKRKFGFLWTGPLNMEALGNAHDCVLASLKRTSAYNYRAIINFSRRFSRA